MGNVSSVPTLPKSRAGIRIKINANVGSDIAHRKFYMAAATTAAPDGPSLSDMGFTNFSSGHERREDKTIRSCNWTELFRRFYARAENECSRGFDDGERKKAPSDSRYGLLVLLDYQKLLNRSPGWSAAPSVGYTPVVGHLHDNGLFHV